MNFFKTTFMFLFLFSSLVSYAADWNESLKKAIEKNNVEEVKRCLPHISKISTKVIFKSCRFLNQNRLTPEEESYILDALEMSIYDPDLMSLEDIFNTIGIRQSESSKALVILDLLLKASAKSEYYENHHHIFFSMIFGINTFLFKYMLMHQPIFIINDIPVNLLLYPTNFDYLKIFLSTYKKNTFLKSLPAVRLLEIFFKKYSTYSFYNVSHAQKVLNEIFELLGTHINDRNIMTNQTIIDLALEKLIETFDRVNWDMELYPNAGWIVLTLAEHGANLEEALQRISNPEHQTMIRNFLVIERDRRNAAAAREVENILLDNEEQIEPEPNSWTNYIHNIVRTTLLAPFFFFHNQNS